MIPTGQDSLNTRSTLSVGSTSYAYYSLKKAGEALGDVARLPFSMKVLLENLLRFEDGQTVTRDDLQAMVTWLKERRINREIQSRRARVLMQDFTGVSEESKPKRRCSGNRSACSSPKSSVSTWMGS